MGDVKVAIISSNPENEILVKSFKKNFRKVIFAPPEEVKLSVGKEFQVYYRLENLFDFDYILTLPSYSQREFFYTLLRIVEKNVEVPIPSQKFFIMWNKVLLRKLLLNNGIEIRKTFAIAQNIAADMIMDKLKLPVMITSPSGKRVWIGKEKTLKDVLSLFKPGYTVIVEKPLKPSAVLETFVVGEEVIAYQKIGGRVEEAVLDRITKQMAIRVRRLLSSDFCYIKFLELKKKKMLISEVSLSPDFKKFYEVTGKNVGEILASYIREKLEKRSGWLDGFIESLTSFVRWVENEISNIRSFKEKL